MSLKAKIEAVIYASEEPVTLQQLVGLLAGEAQAELDQTGSVQSLLPLVSEADESGAGSVRNVLEAGTRESPMSELVSKGSTAELRAVLETEVVSLNASDADSRNSSELQSEELGASLPDFLGERTAEAALLEADVQVASWGKNEIPQIAPEEDRRQQREWERAIREHVRRTVDALIREYREGDRGTEIREVASGFRMGTKPEYHDAVRGFVKSLKPALKLTLPALETLAVVAYKQPVTAAEISEIRGVDSAGVLGGLMARKLIATAGRKQVIGRPMLYKTTRDFLLRFGLKDVNELPSMEEFERMAGELAEQEDLPMETTDAVIEQANARGDAEHIRDATSSEGELEPAENIHDTAAVEAAASTHEEATAEIAAGGDHDQIDNEERGAAEEPGSKEADQQA